VEEVGRIAEFARQRDMLVHMDGARFANAVASLGCAPNEITWRLGVDALSFGGTKNGLAAGELVVFFRRELGREFEYRAKQAGQLASKMRFLAAPWHTLLMNDVWLKNARHANAAAQRLASSLEKRANMQPVFPVEANAVFVRMTDAEHQDLEARGWHTGNFFEPGIYRLMCSWSTTDELIDQFVGDFVAARNA
jgi:threonine aldolase